MVLLLVLTALVAVASASRRDAQFPPAFAMSLSGHAGSLLLGPGRRCVLCALLLCLVLCALSCCVALCYWFWFCVLLLIISRLFAGGVAFTTDMSVDQNKRTIVAKTSMVRCVVMLCDAV